MDICVENSLGTNIYIGNSADLLPQLLPQRRVIVISDTNIDRCYSSLLSGYEHLLIGLGEQSKTLVTVEKLYRSLLDMGADRSCFILGVGGGIVTDVAGFVASTYMRGVDFGFVSTSLLGQVDASIGGKNGVNIAGFKNIVGTFTPPKFVVCDVGMLKTLPKREFRAGMAEVIKSAIIGDAELFELLETVSIDELCADTKLVTRVVEAAMRVKIGVVSRDEHEKGERRILNLGHTLAHAIEQASRGINHGEAVAMGLYYVTLVARNMECISLDTATRICALIERYGFATELPVSMRKLLKATSKDKKREGGKIHLILPTGIGAVCDMPLSQTEVDTLFLATEKVKL